MRYTEARLTHAAMALMEDLDKETVEMIPNYDETKTEPTVFPAKFPNLLCNGSSGIAVGMATNIPPHNFDELDRRDDLVLDNRSASHRRDHEGDARAPTFRQAASSAATGASKKPTIQAEARSSFARSLRVEDLPNQRQQIIVDEIPYNVNKSSPHQADRRPDQ